MTRIREEEEEQCGMSGNQELSLNESRWIHQQSGHREQRQLTAFLELKLIPALNTAFGVFIVILRFTDVFNNNDNNDFDFHPLQLLFLTFVFSPWDFYSLGHK